MTAGPQTIHPTKLAEIVEQGHPIVDVRTEMEHITVNLDHPHDLVTLDELNPADYMMRRGYDHETPVYILCRSGKRATTAAHSFVEAGYKNAYVIEGGIIAAEEHGEPVNKGGAKPSDAAAGNSGPVAIDALEKQVRAIAGGIVLLGLLLGAASALFYILAVLAGIALLLSGLTGKCYLAAALTKAPWNKDLQTGAACELKMELPKKDDAGTHGGCA